MKSLWPDSFAEADKPSAKNILEEQAKLLPKLTEGMVFAEIEELDYGDKVMLPTPLRDEFAYDFRIKGKFLPGYSFKVFTFSHDIAFYPVTIRIDSSIKDELSTEVFVKLQNPEELESFVQSVFTSQRIKNVIGGILRLSR